MSSCGLSSSLGKVRIIYLCRMSPCILNSLETKGTITRYLIVSGHAELFVVYCHPWARIICVQQGSNSVRQDTESELRVLALALLCSAPLVGSLTSAYSGSEWYFCKHATACCSSEQLDSYMTCLTLQQHKCCANYTRWIVSCTDMVSPKKK